VEEYVNSVLSGNEKKKKGKKQVTEDKAATKIQSKARAKHAKKEVADKKKAKEAKPEEPKVDPLSPAALYGVLSKDPKGFVVHVTPKRLAGLYQDTQAAGLTNEFLNQMSGGKVTERPPKTAIEQMAVNLARAGNKLGHQEFNSFMSQLSEELSTEPDMIVRAFRQTEEGSVPQSDDLVKKLFIIRQKQYKYGATFNRSDWTVVCRNCDWLNAMGFTQGDAEMVFSQQCKAEKLDKGGLGGGGNQTIWKDSSFAGLIQLLAARKGIKPLKAIGDIWKTAKKLSEEGVSTAATTPEP
jgi:hypothetical protein